MVHLAKRALDGDSNSNQSELMWFRISRVWFGLRLENEKLIRSVEFTLAVQVLNQLSTLISMHNYIFMGEHALINRSTNPKLCLLEFGDLNGLCSNIRFDVSFSPI